MIIDKEQRAQLKVWLKENEQLSKKIYEQVSIEEVSVNESEFDDMRNINNRIQTYFYRIFKRVKK